jgi:hypothetical protein
MTTQTHWKKLVNQDYIGAYALTPGEDLTVTIKKVGKREIKGTGGRDQECLVATLDGQKPLILNATNSKTIAKLYGAFIENWEGKQISLFASTTMLAGEQVECLRIRPTVGAPKKRSISEDRLTTALAAVEEGKFTVSTLLEKYELTEAQLARLPKQIEGGA